MTDALAWIDAVGIEVGVVAEVGNNRNRASSRGGELADRRVAAAWGDGQTTAASDEFLSAHLRAVKGLDGASGAASDGFRPSGIAIHAFAIDAFAVQAADAARGEPHAIPRGGRPFRTARRRRPRRVRLVRRRGVREPGPPVRERRAVGLEARARDRSGAGAVRGRPAGPTRDAR